MTPHPKDPEAEDPQPRRREADKPEKVKRLCRMFTGNITAEEMALLSDMDESDIIPT